MFWLHLDAFDRLARVVQVVQMCYGAVKSGIVITKRCDASSTYGTLPGVFIADSAHGRDIYYHDVELFKKQSVVDKVSI